MDVQMPIMDGIEAARRIRAGNSANRDVPIVAITASAERTIWDGCLAAGMNDVITKPLLFARLVDILQRWQPGAEGGDIRASFGSGHDAPPETTTCETVTDEAPLDYVTLIERLEGDRGFAKILLDGFCHQTEAMLGEMQRALDAADMEALRRAAHTIKGGALNIVAEDLQAAAKALEETAGGGDGDAGALLTQIVTEFQRLKVYLAATLGT
jgi:CheY-like chemotaxis protein